MRSAREIYELLVFMIQDDRDFTISSTEFSQENAVNLVLHVSNKLQRIPHEVKATKSSYYGSIRDLLVALQQKTGSQL